MKTCSFSKEKHLRTSTDFQKVRELNNKLFSKSLVLYYLENNLEHPRLGVVVSKKVSKKAVVRNLVKRRIREIFRLNQNQIEAVDLIVIAKAQAVESTFLQLEANLMKALRYAKKTKI